jgi:uncharacterized protein YecE (DUF72 family)
VGRVDIGCSGWSYAHWRDPVYGGRAARCWLELYAERFRTVEVNTSFYRLPRRSMVAGWVDRTPEDFRFSVKASRYLTHIRRLRDVRDGTRRLLERIEPLLEARRLDALLWQLPPNFERDDARLASALEEMPTGIRNTIEFRHRSWFCPPVLRLLRQAGAGLAIGDDPSRPYQLHRPTARLVYVRLHRGSRGRRGNYSPRELDDWAERVRRWSRRHDVLVYFNNDWEAFAVANAVGLERRVSARSSTSARAGRRRPRP